MDIKIKTGGAPREAFGKDKIIPFIFSKEPFNDASFQLYNLDKLIREDEVSEFIIMIRKKEGGCRYVWRGELPITSILGLIEYTKMLLQKDFVE